MAKVLRIHHGDDSWLLSELTGVELGEIERKFEISYFDWQPAQYAYQTLAVLATFLTRTRPEAEVAEILKSIKADEVVKLWTVEDDDFPTEFEEGIPKDAAADMTTTIGSSSSPDPPGAGFPAIPEPSPSET